MIDPRALENLLADPDNSTADVADALGVDLNHLYARRDRDAQLDEAWRRGMDRRRHDLNKGKPLQRMARVLEAIGRGNDTLRAIAEATGLDGRDVRTAAAALVEAARCVMVETPEGERFRPIRRRRRGRPKKQRKQYAGRKAKYIYRVGAAYSVRIPSPDGGIIRGTFRPCEFGGNPLRAFHAALRWRNRALAVNGLPITERPVCLRPTRRTKYALGVERWMIRRKWRGSKPRAYYVARWVEGGRERRKMFAVSKWGEEGAREKAISHRASVTGLKPVRPSLADERGAA